jgi:hypothetical protein
MGQRRVTLQSLWLADGQNLHCPTGTLCQRSHQIAVTRVVAVTGEYRQFVRIRPLPHQRPPRRMSCALHQFEARRAGGNQARVERTHLRGAVQRVG